MRNDEADDGLLILQVLLNLIDSIEPLGFAFDILGLILVVVVFDGELQLLDEHLLGVFV